MPLPHKTVLLWSHYTHSHRNIYNHNRWIHWVLKRKLKMRLLYTPQEFNANSIKNRTFSVKVQRFFSTNLNCDFNWRITYTLFCLFYRIILYQHQRETAEKINPTNEAIHSCQNRTSSKTRFMEIVGFSIV